MDRSVKSTDRLGKFPADWMDVPPVFVVGPPRSGTTLLRVMLTAHPNISISSEGAYVYQIACNLSEYANGSDTQDNMRKLHEDLQQRLEREKFLGIPSVEQLLDWVGTHGVSLRSLITFYGTWEARVLGKQQLAWWGDNAPYHVHYIPLFSSLFPDCRFIVTVRDPRDTCASAKRNLPWRGFEKNVLAWEQSLLHGLVAQFTLGTQRVKIVRYEELVREPRAVLQDISDFLGVDYTDDMLKYHDSGAAVAIGKLTRHMNVQKPVFATSIGKYRESLTQEEIDTIEERLLNSMFHLGYLSDTEYRFALQRKDGIELDTD